MDEDELYLKMESIRIKICLGDETLEEYDFYKEHKQEVIDYLESKYYAWKGM